jgi:hypothetical protein
MQDFSLTESVTLFWCKDMEELNLRPESRFFTNKSVI